MNNEEKILKLLGQLTGDVAGMKTEMTDMKENMAEMQATTTKVAVTQEKRYDAEQIALKKKISALQAEIDAEEKSKHSAATFLQPVKKYTDIQELTPGILNELVEKIVVYQAEGTGKNRTQRREIQYNFVGIFNTPEGVCLPQSVMIDTRQGVAVEYNTRKIA